MKRTPLRGEIWFARFPTDPPDRPERPVVIVSTDARNRHPRANTVLVAPLSGSVERDVVTHIKLQSGETGLYPSCIRCEDITVVRKESLVEARQPLRTLSHARVCQIAERVFIAMGCQK